MMTRPNEIPESQLPFTVLLFVFVLLCLSHPRLAWCRDEMAVSKSGVPVPGESRPSSVYAKLFLDGRPKEKALQLERLKEGRSVLDMVVEKAREMQRRVNTRDGRKLEEYLTAVRETEVRLAKAEAWEHRPKPVVDYKRPTDVSGHRDVIRRAQLMYDLAYLAFQTDSTRVITYAIGGPSAVHRRSRAFPGSPTVITTCPTTGEIPGKSRSSLGSSRSM